MSYSPFPPPVHLPAPPSNLSILAQVARGLGMSMILLGTVVTGGSLAIFVLGSLFSFVGMLLGMPFTFLWQVLVWAGLGVLGIMLGSLLVSRLGAPRGGEPAQRTSDRLGSALLMITGALLCSVVLACVALAVFFL